MRISTTFSILYRIELGGTVSPTASGQAFRDWSFSILYRIELGGTVGGGFAPCAPSRLSVSSIGSNWVELGGLNLSQLRDFFFQYPLSDRIGWNYTMKAMLRDDGKLSVSSIGSNWVELCVLVMMAIIHFSFSILYRIELGGTFVA